MIDSHLVEQMVLWRQDLHAHPELAFAERRTSDLVARELARFGLSVRRGLGKTGVVGTLFRGAGPAIGLRADMDALPIRESTGLPYASRHPAVMHACGHDGHVAMLLGAAHCLARQPDLSGTVHFIFQPAEEGAGGGRVMVEEGLFRDFPCDTVWGLHNWPGLPLGTLGTCPGPIMGSLDTFEIRVRGSGTHAAMPERGIDPFIPTAEIVQALQTIVSRRIAPFDPSVVSVTQIHGGDAMNVIPDYVDVRGTIRCLSDNVRTVIAGLIRDIASGIAKAHGGAAEVAITLGYPTTLNAADAIPLALAAAGKVEAIRSRNGNVIPSLASEDFAYMLQACPGAYVWLGVDGSVPSQPLHSPVYDFNDDALPIGASYWVALARELLSP